MSPAEGLIAIQKLKEFGKKQMAIELRGALTVKSILKKEEKTSQDHFVELKWSVELKHLCYAFIGILIEGHTGSGGKGLGYCYR